MLIRLARVLIALVLATVAVPAAGAGITNREGLPPLPLSIPAQYAIADLGTLPGWDVRFAPVPMAINAGGDVVGTVYTGGGQRAFLYRGGTLSELAAPSGTPAQALGINADGQVVGAIGAYWQRYRAVRWQGGVLTNLAPTLGERGLAYGIDDGGRIVGTSGEPTDYGHPVLWDGATLVDLVPSGEDYGVAYAIAATGHIAGVSGQYVAESHATLWRDGSATNLGIPDTYHNSAALALNGLDDAVGYADGGYDPFFFIRAYLWRDGVAHDLGTLGGDQSMATSINDAGQIVGWAETRDLETRAVIWANGRIVDLNERLPTGAGWVLQQAQAINAAGQIVGLGTHNGEPRAFILTPGPASGSRALSLTATGPGKADVEPAGPTYDPGTLVTLRATADPGAIFLGWTVDGAFAGWSPELTLTMDIDHLVRAAFLAAPSGFTDHPGTLEAAALAQLAVRDVTHGYGDGRYGPGDPLQRAQVAALVSRALMRNKGTAHSFWFDDRCDAQGCANDDLWNAVIQLADLGVLYGYGDRTFGPFDNVSELDTITIITRAMVFKRYWVWQPDDPTLFPDVPRRSDRASLATWVHYVGAPPDRPISGTWATWNGPASRGWTARAIWQALDGQFGVDRIP